MEKSIGVGIFGKGVQECSERARVPIGLAGGLTGIYEAPVVPDSNAPALLGLTSLKKNRAVIDL
eukprot:11183811-Heterocapsa_arctica.AAC.1